MGTIDKTENISTIREENKPMEPFFVTDKDNKDLDQALNSKSTEKYRNNSVKFPNQK